MTRRLYNLRKKKQKRSNLHMQVGVKLWHSVRRKSDQSCQKVVLRKKTGRREKIWKVHKIWSTYRGWKLPEISHVLEISLKDRNKMKKNDQTTLVHLFIYNWRKHQDTGSWSRLFFLKVFFLFIFLPRPSNEPFSISFYFKCVKNWQNNFCATMRKEKVTERSQRAPAFLERYQRN